MVDLHQAVTVLRIIAAVAMLLLAAWFVVLNWRSSLHTIFAGLLVALAAVTLGPSFDPSSSVGLVARWGSLLLLLLLPIFTPLFMNGFSASHCVAHVHSSVPVETTLLRFFRFVPLLVGGLYVWDATLFAHPTEVGRLLDPRVAVGPLYAAAGLELVAFALMSHLFEREFNQTRTPLHRNAYLFVALGFGLAVAYEGPVRLLLTLLGPVSPAELGWARYASLVWAAIATAIVGKTISNVASTLRSRLEPEHRPGARLVLVLFLTAAATAGAIGILGGRAFASAMAAHAVVSVLWVLTLPFLVAYAILRHHLFEIDLAMRYTVRGGTVAAIFVTVFFAVTEGAQELFSNRWGPVFGIGASALLVFAMAPLQRFADRIAQSAVPEAKSIADLTKDERLTFYREQCHVAWGDGQLNAKERILLRNLREKLGISAEEALQVEELALHDHPSRAHAHAAPAGTH